MSTAGRRVFVSSTCYDLIDLRAEVEEHLRSLGLVPVMSDRLESDFEVSGDVDSIRTCLVNVRKCDVIVVVLSKRYGPRLGKFGFDDVCATHLEYREAKKAGIPVYFYVRDRLRADYDTWRADPNAKLRWVDSGNHGLFEFIGEHEPLKTDAKGTNWIWPFKDSFELRGRLTTDLRAVSLPAVLERLIDADEVPFLIMGGASMQGGCGGLSVETKLENASATESALNLEVRIDGSWKPIERTVHLKPNGHVSIKWSYPPIVPSQQHVFSGPSVRYRTRRGHFLQDDFQATVTFDSAAATTAKDIRFHLVRRALSGERAITLAAGEDQSGDTNNRAPHEQPAC